MRSSSVAFGLERGGFWWQRRRKNVRRRSRRSQKQEARSEKRPLVYVVLRAFCLPRALVPYPLLVAPQPRIPVKKASCPGPTHRRWQDQGCGTQAVRLCPRCPDLLRVILATGLPHASDLLHLIHNLFDQACDQADIKHLMLETANAKFDTVDQR